MPAHPAGTRGAEHLIDGCIGEFQLMFAALAVKDGYFKTVEDATEKAQMWQAQNKNDMLIFLREIEIDPSAIARASFVHLPLDLAKQVWNHFLDAFGFDIAQRCFVDRIWVWTDVCLCAHGSPTCVCTSGCARGGTCHHGRKRYYCKECEGDGICEHGRKRYYCKECEGAGICEHGKHRYYCKMCEGAGICEHGRQKAICKDCGGKGICVHDRKRQSCKDCGGSSICEHGKQRYFCVPCGGGGICEHKKQKYQCKVCKDARAAGGNGDASGKCEHGKQRYFCVPCGGPTSNSCISNPSSAMSGKAAL